MGGLLVAAEIEKFIAVADDGLPLLFKQRLQLGEVLDDDTDTDFPGAHGGQQLVKFIGQCHIRKLVHEEMHRHGQAAAMHPVGAVKQFLEGAGIEQAD